MMSETLPHEPAPPPAIRVPAPAWGGLWWALTGLYFAVTLAAAGVKTGWYDEWFTIAIARLPIGNAWTALGDATDMNPPLLYVVEKPFLSLGLPDVFAARLPSILGFYLLLAGVYRFGSGSGHAGAGLVAALTVLVSASFAYAFEARPYALVLGACGGALICWPAAADGRRWGMAGLCGCVAVAVSSHYYGLFAVLPFFVGETVRTVQRRRLNGPTTAALVLGLLPLLLWLPLLLVQKGYAGLLGPPSAEFVQEAYKILFGRAIVPTLAGIGLLAVWPARPSGVRESSTPLPAVACAATFLALPIVLFVCAKLTGASVGLRYVAPTAVGAAMLAGLTVGRLCAADAAAWKPLAVAFAAWFLALSAWDVLKYRAEWATLQTGFAWVQAAEYGDAPVVTAEPLTYPTWRAYAPTALRDRLWYVPNPDAAERYRVEKKYSLDGAYLQLDRHCGPLGIRTLDEVAAGRPRVLIYGMPARGWVAGGFLGRGWTVTKVRGDGMEALYVAERPRGAP
ncbi:hypothetical protein [Limnoglobus roseus]|uniref:Glycosyltransferase RgtA/B/C/D-like domain-containing protein n=1 Tax=Limnoglobus roseus TaxID=2598579 RepID=A0A5C1AEZ0_9BACT|nr:hypothetical protein [Limnoglobus roseus]QEL15558.1 hypothetical protein PX52LOC_02483 [Limnoglobus roseus]